MNKVKVAWTAGNSVSPKQACTGKEPSVIRYQEVQCHMIFDVENAYLLTAPVGKRYGADSDQSLLVIPKRRSCLFALFTD
jgi:hypothetical protein